MAGKAPKFESEIYYTPKTVAGFNVYEKPKESIDEIIAQMTRSDIENTKMEELRLKLKMRVAETKEELARLGVSTEKGGGGEIRTVAKPKRFTVIDGEIVRDDESGDYTLSEAAILARKQRGPEGGNLSDLVGAINLLNPGQQLSLGDLTSSIKDIATTFQPQSQGLSASELDAKLQLQRLQQKEETRSLFKELTLELRPPGENTQRDEPPFIPDGQGGFTINPNGRLTGNDILAWQMLNSRSSGLGYLRDGENVYPVETFLKVKTWEREEDRKDKELKIKEDTFKLAKDNAPMVVEALRGLGGPQGKARESLDRGGWGSKPGLEVPQVVTVHCANCSSPISFMANTKMVSCQQCGETNFIGKPKELKQEVEKWNTMLQEVSQTKSTLPLGPLAEASSEPGSEGDSPPSSKRSRSKGSAKSK